ncbi:MAG: hypothetical protein KGJ59_13115 [Bacteroidota bacterium]|nr:hypothetical protein [Bacteroidota bacterium]
MLRSSVKIFSLLSIFASLCFSSHTIAQSLDSTALREGSWALQFGIAGNFSLVTFQGSTIAVKYQLSDRNALRGGITLYGNTSDGTNSLSGAIADTSDGTVPASNSSSAANVAVIFQYVWYLNPSGPVRIYNGLGPSVSYYSYHSSTDNAYLDIINSSGYWVQAKYTSNSSQWGVGVAGMVGAEWFASRWLSLHAAYNETIQYQWRSTTSTEDRSSLSYPNYIPYRLDNTGTNKGWYFSYPNVSFGVNVYL